MNLIVRATCAGTKRGNMHEAAMTALSHKPKMPKGMKDERKHGIAETRIEHNHDGSHQITHHHMKPGMEPTKHGAPDLEGLQDHLQEMLHGKPSPEELEAEE
jgi:hypothetical protein